MDSKKLRVLLAERGLTQIALAACLGISPASLSYWMKGHYRPPKEAQERIARFFGIQMDELFPNSDHGESVQT